MSDKKISQLTGASTPLAGTEVLPIVQSGSTVKVASNDLTVKNVRSNATTGILQVAGPAAGATRTMTVPDANFTVARTDAANTFAADQTISTGATLTYLNVVNTAGTGNRYSAISLKDSATQNALFYQNHNDGNLLIRNDSAGGSAGLYTQTATYGAVLSSTGNFSITNGNLVVGTAAKGIDFSANTGAAGMTSELLNWYEEGTWTPAFTLQSGSVTLATALGRYTRIGRQVTLNAYIKVDTPSSPSGFMLMTGLPFPPADISGNNLYAGSIIVNTMLTTVTGNWVVQPRLNGDLRFYVGDNTSLSNPGANLQADSEIWLTCTYVV